MVTLRKQELSYTSERFEGASGRYWKTGTKGTATQFSLWVRENIRNLTVNNSVVKTSREFVANNGPFEELVMSFGRKDGRPLDIHVGVVEGQNSYIDLEYPRANTRDSKRYTIKNPMSLSVDPTTKQLISVAFKGPQFSFAGVKSRNLESIPGYTDALRALSQPIMEAARILDTFDTENYRSRNLQDFEAAPEVIALKERYQDWDIDTDASKLASQNKVTYIFTHPTNNTFNFTVYFKDEGGGKYRAYATYQDREMNIENLNKRLAKEVDRLQNEDIIGGYSQQDSNLSTGSIAKSTIDDSYKQSIIDDLLSMPEMIHVKERYSNWDAQRPKVVQTSNATSVSFPFYYPRDPKFNFSIVATTTPRGDFKFYALFRDKQISLTDLDSRLKDVESYQRVDELSTSKVSGDTQVQDLVKNTTMDLDSIVKRLNRAIDDPHIDRISNLDITRFDNKEVWELKLKTQHGEKSLVWEIDLSKPIYDTTFIQNDYFNDLPTTPFTFNTEEFYKVVATAAAKFRNDFAVFKTLRAKIDPKTGSFINADYDLANWADRILAKVTPELQSLQDKYSINLDVKRDDVDGRDRSGSLLFSGNFVDTSFVDHLVDIEVNYDHGDRFEVWIKVDGKGNRDSRVHGQSDLSSLRKWAEETVAPRSAQPNSTNYQHAIEKELINLGGIPGTIRGTVDISTDKIKPVTIAIKATNNKVLVTAYRDNRVIAEFSIDVAPFSEKPIKMARTILAKLQRTIKESFPSVDRQFPALKCYLESLFSSLEQEGIRHPSFNTIQKDGKSYILEVNSLGEVTLKSLLGNIIKEAQLHADVRDFPNDVLIMHNLLDI